MKIKSIIIALIFSISVSALMAQTQTEKPKLYTPEANAKKEISEAIAKAKKESKNVFIQVGGNWCVWCLRFNKLVTETPELTKIMNDNYVVLHVNYSKENKNEDVLASLGYPQRFGFPVFVVLDANGKRLNTQNSAYLEDGKGGHSEKLVSEFLQSWTPAAINPATYNK
jgi:thiol:disulfide interchange protein